MTIREYDFPIRELIQKNYQDLSPSLSLSNQELSLQNNFNWIFHLTFDHFKYLII